MSKKPRKRSQRRTDGLSRAYVVKRTAEDRKRRRELDRLLKARGIDLADVEPPIVTEIRTRHRTFTPPGTTALTRREIDHILDFLAPGAT